MNRILITLSLFLCVTFSSFSQDGSCCPDFTADLTVVDCSVEICLVPTSKKKKCKNPVFFVQIHNQDGDLVFNGSPQSFCFTIAGTPGDTYTVSGTVSQDPTPIECFPPAQILESTVTVPEDCGCCPTLALTVDVDACELVACWEIANPDVEYCPEGSTIELGIENIFNGEFEFFVFGAGDDCFTWDGAVPGNTYLVRVRIVKQDCATIQNITGVTVTVPLDCECCPDLTASVEYEECDVVICYNTVDSHVDLCEEGFNTILAVVRDENGNIVETNPLHDSNCFTWTGGEPGQTFTVGGRIDYPYDCDGTGDVIPVTFTIPEDCGDTVCQAPQNIECHPDDNDFGLTWDGPLSADSYLVEIRSYVEGDSCCEPHQNIQAVEFLTTEPSIESMKDVAHFNCLVLRITTICDDGIGETTDWICFNRGYWGCPNGLVGQEESEIRTNTNKLERGTDINIYPNPGSDIINLEGENLQIGVSISVFSITGEFISRAFVSKENQFSKDISTLNPGQYQVMVNSADGTLIQQLKFVKI